MRVMLVCLLLLPAASAVTWSDDAGDHRLGYATHMDDGEPQYQWTEPGDQGWYGNVDIVSATIEETASELVFTIVTESDSAEGPPGEFLTPQFDEYVHGFRFDFGGEQIVAMWPNFFGGDDAFIGQAREFSIFGGSVIFPSGFISTMQPVEGGGWTGTLSKSAFRDENLVPLREGDVLDNVRVFSQENDVFSNGATLGICPDAPSDGGRPSFGAGCGWTVLDDAEGTSITIEQTPPGVGHIFLRFEAPYRLSNGLATTYLYEASLHNLEAIDDTVVLQVSDVPSGWEVRHPTQATFNGEGEQTIPIAVTVPFNHEHGATKRMTLSAVSQHNESAIVESTFGVVFADPPQPAGHHSTLHFFGEDFCNGNCAYAYMNAGTQPIERFFGSETINEVPADWQFRGASDPEGWLAPAERFWDIPLSPALGIGLDFDVSEQADLRMDLRFDDDWTGPVTATLDLIDYREDEVTFTALASGRADVVAAAGSTQSVEVLMDVNPEADLIHFEAGRSLGLTIHTVDTSGLPYMAKQGDIHLVTSDTTLDLPLFDYHEEVDLSGLDFAELTIQRLNGTFRFVNPGNTTVFGFDVGNLGDSAATIDWELNGPDEYLEWATITPRTTTAPAGGNATVVVRISAPLDAEEGDVAELLLVGMQRGSETPLYGRITALVTDNFEVPDESAAAQELEAEAEGTAGDGKDSPGIGLLAGLAAVAVALRRRQ